MSANYSGYTKVLLIEPEFADSCFVKKTNPKTYPLVYSYQDDPAKLKTFLTTKFPFVRRIGIVTHGPANVTKPFRVPEIVGMEPLFKDSDLVPTATTFSSRVQLLKDLVKAMSITRIDFLGCNLLRLPKWKTYFNVLKKGFPSLVIGASNDNTGNLKYGGNWTMENTGDNIKAEYFTTGISNYTGLLNTYTADANGYTFAYAIDTSRTNSHYIQDVYDLGTTNRATTGDLVIPSTLDGGANTVAYDRIAQTTFQRSFTSVTYPSTIFALAGTDSGKYFGAATIDATQCALVTQIHVRAFQFASITAISLHPNTVNIRSSCFFGCPGLTTVNFGAGTTNLLLESNALRNCSSLTTVNFGAGTTNVVLGNDTFRDCPNLVMNDFSMIKEIGGGCFMNCTSLPSSITSSMFSTNVTKIGMKLFEGCTQITSIEIAQVDASVLDDKFGAGSFKFGASNVSTMILPNNLTTLGKICSETKITSITIPSTVTSIAKTQTFYNCTSLHTINDFPSVPAIPDQCFRGCSVLTGFSLPSSIITIGSLAFLGCHALVRVVVPEAVTTIGAGAFQDLDNLESIVFPDTLTTVLNTNGTAMDSTNYHGNGFSMVSHCPKLKTVVYGDGLPCIGRGECSSGGKKLESIIIGSSVTHIGYAFHEAFSEMAGLFTGSRPKLTFRGVPTAIHQNAFFFGGGARNAYVYSILDLYMMNGDTEYKYTAGPVGSKANLDTIVTGFDASTAISSGNFKKTSEVPIPAANPEGVMEYTSFAGSIDLTDTDIIGTTTVEQRKFSFKQMKRLRDKVSNNGGFSTKNFFVLKNVNKLPAFRKAYTELRVFQSNTEISTEHAAVGSAMYVAIDVGEHVTIPASDAVDALKYKITKTGDTSYTLQELPAGAITTHATGDEITLPNSRFKGLLGGVEGEYEPDPAMHLVLSAFDSSFALTTNGLVGEKAVSISGDATITLSTTVSKDILRNTFFYRTDDVILGDSSFVYHYVDSAAFTNATSTLNPKNGTIASTTDGAYIAGDNISKDYLRDLAKQLFGTTLGVDLFSNEDAVVTNINSKCDDVATAVFSKLTDVNLSSASFTDASFNNYKYSKDDGADTNICRELLTQMYALAPTRFSDGTSYAYTGNGNTLDGYFQIPFQSGDVISYKVTVTPAADQLTAIATGVSALTPRSYQVNLNVGE
jgi:hypothetical protein